MGNHFGLIVGAVAVVFILAFVIIVVSIIRNGKGGHRSGHHWNDTSDSSDIGGSSFD
jgi:hypothetical protein